MINPLLNLDEEVSERVKLGVSMCVPDRRETRKGQFEKLARLHNVGTSYIGAAGDFREIATESIRKVLTALGVACSSDEEIAASIKLAEEKRWITPIKKTIIEIQGYRSDVDVYLPTTVCEGSHQLDLRVILEEGTNVDLPKIMMVKNLSESLEEQVVGGVQYQHRVFTLSHDIPLGYHTIALNLPIAGARGEARADARTDTRTDAQATANADAENSPVENPPVENPSPENPPAENTPTPFKVFEAHLIVTPEKAPEVTQKHYGFMSQIYSQRSYDSWGMGDFEDMRFLGESTTNKLGADFMLINPTQADSPSLPQTPSPYLPVSRQFVNPIYIRPEAIPEYSNLFPMQKTLVDDLARMAKGLNSDREFINRDAIWSLKKQALRQIFDCGLVDPERNQKFKEFEKNGGNALTGFAVWSLLVEKKGFGESWTEHKISDKEIMDFALKYPNDVEFYRWLQFIADEQMHNAHLGMLEAGAKIGIMADLAVGVNPLGADVWINPKSFVKGVSVGAPPDVYNQQGQDWSEPPLSPEGLENTGYKIFHNLVRQMFKNAGAIRIDHVLGMFRLWFVPAGDSPKNGAYVYYNHDIMIGILALEAYRSGGIIIGEDLGVVPAGVFDYLKQRGIFGTSILWFERLREGQKKGSPRPVTALRSECLASVTTHDIPPTLAYLRGEHVKLRHQLGLLTEDYKKMLHEQQIDREKTVNYLIHNDFLRRANSGDEIEIAIALQRSLFQAPSKLIAFAFTDFVGETRTQNQPGTNNEYPNWRIPLQDINHNLVYNNNIFENETFKRFTSGLADNLNTHENASENITENFAENFDTNTPQKGE